MTDRRRLSLSAPLGSQRGLGLPRLGVAGLTAVGLSASLLAAQACQQLATGGAEESWDALPQGLASAMCERDVACEAIQPEAAEDCKAAVEDALTAQFSDASQAGNDRDVSCDDELVAAMRNLPCDASEQAARCALTACRGTYGAVELGKACGPDVDDCAQGLFCSPDSMLCVDACVDN